MIRIYDHLCSWYKFWIYEYINDYMLPPSHSPQIRKLLHLCGNEQLLLALRKGDSFMIGNMSYPLRYVISVKVTQPESMNFL
jgi:hypothetical protein